MSEWVMLQHHLEESLIIYSTVDVLSGQRFVYSTFCLFHVLSVDILPVHVLTVDFLSTHLFLQIHLPQIPHPE
uniref:Uncharacterized protein n=1 Tax=Lepeophtheirus salmonis TaxID=72036 RepID=A0A0K2UHY2_LEPSM